MTDRSEISADLFDRAKAADEISKITLGLARQARAAGLTSLCTLLETAALTAAADAATAQWPKQKS